MDSAIIKLLKKKHNNLYNQLREEVNKMKSLKKSEEIEQ